MMTAADMGLVIDVIVAKADDLRRVGVTRLTLDGVVLELGAQWVAADEPTPEAPLYEDPLLDPATFGGILPSRPPLAEEE